MQPKYKRVLLKLSGEALAGDQRFGLNHEVIEPVVKQIVELHNMGVEVGLVIGGGNFWRGRQGTKMDRTTADHMGMLATVMNSLAMMDAIEQYGVPVRVQTALNMISVAEPLILRKALRHFEMGRIVIFACGTGHPYCSTDTAAALRACEIDADILLMANYEAGDTVVGCYHLMKGMEFDAVIVCWPDCTVTDGERRRLYTSCSRALHAAALLGGSELIKELGIVL